MKSWVTCVLSFGDRRRELMRPGHYTELFFLDEATALAAGHRPCAECRRDAYRAFKRFWAAGRGESEAGVTAHTMDRALHEDRLDGKTQRTFTARLVDLPDGTLLAIDQTPFLKWAEAVRPWTFDGYGASTSVAEEFEVTVVTPSLVVDLLRAGYRPEVHPSANL